MGRSLEELGNKMRTNLRRRANGPVNKLVREEQGIGSRHQTHWMDELLADAARRILLLLSIPCEVVVQDTEIVMWEPTAA